MADDIRPGSPRLGLHKMDNLPLRDQLQNLESDTEALKQRLKKIIKTVKEVTTTFQAFEEASKQLADEVLNFGQTVTGEAQDLFIRLGDVMRELVYRQSQTIKQQEIAIAGRLKQYIDVTINGTMNMQSKVDDARREYEIYTEKLHSLKKKGREDKQEKVVKMEQEESKHRQQFDLLTYQYATKMKELLQDVQFTLMEGMSIFVKEKLAYYKSGYDLLRKLEPEMQHFTSKAATLKKTNEETRLDQMIKNVDEKVRSGGLFTDIEKQFKQGYLWLKKKGKWKKRYVSVINGRLLYYKSWKNMTPKGMYNLVLCTIKRVADRPYAFELRTNTNESLYLHANDENDMKQWMDMIQAVIATQLNAGTMCKAGEVKTPSDDVYEELIRIKGNEICADCGKPDPEWAVLDHGICICIECSGVHRSLGTHISKVRSLKLDSWEPELILLMKSIGNAKANANVYEELMPEGVKIGPNADRAKREAFIKTKYVEKKFVEPMEKEKIEEVLQNLQSRKRGIGAVALLKLIAQGADVNWQNPQDKNTLLHKCAEDGNIVGVELLTKSGANLDVVNVNKQTPLHLAVMHNHAGVVRILLHHGASITLQDINNRTPEQLAREYSATDCIPLLTQEEDTSGATAAASGRTKLALSTSAAMLSPTDVKRSVSTVIVSPRQSQTKKTKSSSSSSSSYKKHKSKAATLHSTDLFKRTNDGDLPLTVQAPSTRTYDARSLESHGVYREAEDVADMEPRPRQQAKGRRTLILDKDMMEEEFAKFQMEFASKQADSNDKRRQRGSDDTKARVKSRGSEDSTSSVIASEKMRKTPSTSNLLLIAKSKKHKRANSSGTELTE